jgi:hypothetical protein
MGATVSVFTDSLLQNTRKLVRQDVFGSPETNATYAMALKVELEKQGHCVHVGVWDMKETLKNMYTVTWFETKAKKQAPTESKREFCNCWCEVHADEIYMSLGDALDHFMFISEFFFSHSAVKDTVPKLQRVFQAEAAHTAFGKYTLFSFYGTMANGNMFPVALGMVFGNENKASWMLFCKFIAEHHPSINAQDVMIITNRCKGSIVAIFSWSMSVSLQLSPSS